MRQMWKAGAPAMIPQWVRGRWRAFAVLAPILVLTGCTSALFSPVRGPTLQSEQAPVDHRYVRFDTADDVTLEGWYLEADDAAGTVAFADGAENARHHVETVAWLPRHGYNVLLFNYRGYGGSEGTQSMAGFHRDLRAAVVEAARLDALARDRVVVFGQSLGGSIATVVTSQLPASTQPGALVVDSAPTDYRRVVRETLSDSWLTWPLQVPLSWLVTDRFEAETAAAELPSIPKLWISNPGDETVGPHHTERLYRRAPEPSALWRIRAREHIATLDRRPARRAFVEWLDRAVIGRRARPPPEPEHYAADAGRSSAAGSGNRP